MPLTHPREFCHAPLRQTLIRNAWDDGYPCLVATIGPQGPNITPRGSMIITGDAHLARWERSKRAVRIDKAIDARGKPPM